MKLYYIRHGQSEANFLKIHSGWSQVPLTEQGRLDALRAKRAIENLKFDKVFSSDVARAIETQEIALPEADAERSALLREINVGHLAGKSVEDCYAELGEAYRINRRNHSFSDYGGESYAELSARACATFERIAAENDGKTIAVTTHGGVIRTLFAAWNGISLEQIGGLLHFPNASVTVAEYDCGKVKFLQEGYDGHLAVRTVWAGDN